MQKERQVMYFLRRIYPSCGGNCHWWRNPPLATLIVLACASFGPAQQAVETVSSNKTVPSTTTTIPPTAASADDRYRIGPGDVLDIRILNRPNLSRDAVRVEGNGMIRMPLIDTEIMAACKTEGELAKEIANGHLKFYRNPQVDVFIKEYQSVSCKERKGKGITANAQR